MKPTLMRHLFFAFSALILAALIAPRAVSANTYYVDCSGGSDTNGGTSPTNPWKHAPAMRGFSGNYSHSAGDRFIFKGGVACSSSSFPMAISNSGSSGNHDYYGVDQSWFAGNSWARPVFDMGFTVVGGNGVPIPVTGSHITIDNIEIEHQSVPAGVGMAGAITDSSSSTDILVENCNIHDWRPASPAASYGESDPGGGGLVFLGSNETANSNDIGPAEDASGGTSTCFGTGIWQGTTVSNNTITNACDEIHGAEQTISGNTFTWGHSPYVPTNHNNLVYWVGAGSNTTSYWYNNVMQGPFAGEYEGFFPHPCWGGKQTGVTVYIFNNIIHGTGQTPIEPSDAYCPSGSNVKVYLLNNTCQSGGICGLIINQNGSGGELTSVTVQNNHWISDTFLADAFCYNNEGGVSSCGSANAVTDDASNVKRQATSDATSEGYSQGNEWSPSNSGGITVNHGTNLSSLCSSGPLSNLCKDRLGNPRPTNGSWDAGAYQFSSTSGGQPTPPSGLIAVID